MKIAERHTPVAESSSHDSPTPTEPSTRLGQTAELSSGSTTSVATKEDPSAPSTIRLGHTITLDQLKVTPTKVEFRKVKGKYDDDPETKEPVLALSILVENVSKGQVFQPYISASGNDNFGNPLDKVTTGYNDKVIPKGSARAHDSRQATKRPSPSCLKPKLDTATSYQREISQKCNNKDLGYEHWTLMFDASEIDRSKAAGDKVGNQRIRQRERIDRIEIREASPSAVRKQCTNPFRGNGSFPSSDSPPITATPPIRRAGAFLRPWTARTPLSVVGP